MSAENVAVAAPARVERRSHSRAPMRVILAALALVASFWLMDLYSAPAWSKIQSFLIGYFLGSFVMDWIRQRADRGPLVRAGSREDIG